MKTLKDFDFQGKRVLLRTDFNVPLSKQGDILDDFRIKAAIPSIEYLAKNQAKIIIISHLGRPEKREEKFSLRPIANRLGELLNKKVRFFSDCIGDKVEKEIEKMESGDIVVLENLRFYKGEKENNEKFAKDLAKLTGDIYPAPFVSKVPSAPKLRKLADKRCGVYINDAFAVCHRSHASITGLPKFLPSGIGFSVEKEIETLKQLMFKPKKPLIAIIGGAKVKTKVKLINKLSETTDYVLIGGLIPKEIEWQNVKFKYPEKIILPVDWVDSGDIGEKTIKIFIEKIKKAKTIFWNGPLGKTEEKRFSKATREIAKAVVKGKAFSVVGGGETIEFLTRVGLIKKFSFVSTGGGAMLDYLVDEKLVGIEAICSGK
ncbi:phosphoglycerate kinase [Candidatus Parcubacteria bacterium]|nr:phosphoglycerate kinase [Candidatus Parcubacteria bacterium]